MIELQSLEVLMVILIFLILMTLITVILHGVIIMSAIANLQQAVVNLQTEVAADLAALGNLPNQDVAIQAAADAVTTETAKLAAARATIGA